jgi:hypothetical protein
LIVPKDAIAWRKSSVPMSLDRPIPVDQSEYFKAKADNGWVVVEVTPI